MTHDADPLPSMQQLLDQLSDDARRRALTHPAWSEHADGSYERLEFLGDAVLGLAVARELYARFPGFDEGDLSKMKAFVVSRSSCAKVARAARLGEALRDHAPEVADDAVVSQLSEQERVLAALTESVIGAAFLELGYDVVAPVIVASFEDRIGHAVENRTDAKSELQELAQRSGEVVAYRMVSSEGPDHARSFTMSARLGVDGPEAIGEGRSKKVAEQRAAQRLLDEIGHRSGRSAGDATHGAGS